MKLTYNIVVMIIMLLSLTTIAIAQEEEEHEEIFEQAEEIIKQRVSCEELTLDQLEILGDYFMEQMHPGELHEIMDERMGGEGSASLRQVHINMGLMFYCGQRGAMSSGMINMMMGRGGQGYGMMNYLPATTSSTQDYSNLNWFGFVWLMFSALIFIILILIIVLLIKKLQKK